MGEEVVGVGEGEDLRFEKWEWVVGTVEFVYIVERVFHANSR